MFPTEVLSNKVSCVSNPMYTTEKFIEYCKAHGVKINQTKTVADFCVPFNAVLVGNTVVNFIPSNFQYPESEHFLITSIRGLDGANATLAATAWVAGWGDAAAINGSFTVNNNGNNVLINQPFTLFQKGTNDPNAGWFNLSKPIFWVGQTNLTIQGTWTTATATPNQNGRIELHGIKLI